MMIKSGFDLLQLNATDRSVHFKKPGVMLDFGAFGKGYAVDRAIEILRDAAVPSALLHGGTSTVFGYGRAENDVPWKSPSPARPPAKKPCGSSN